MAAILLDIEGTSTPVTFVTHVLYPYARRHLQRHLEQHADSPDYDSLLSRLHEEHACDQRAGEAVPPWEDPRGARLAAAAAYIEWLMDRDRKSTALKELQGRIWEDGYRRGQLVGEVFADVPRALRRWHDEQLPVGIFSSGSVAAQRLLFRHSAAGDLTVFLQWYFDTRIGPKTDPQSYRRIADAIGVSPEAVLFVSDVTRELDAARRAGMQTRLAIRPGNAPSVDEHGYDVIRSFDELLD